MDSENKTDARDTCYGKRIEELLQSFQMGVSPAYINILMLFIRTENKEYVKVSDIGDALNLPTGV